ncbi:MAG TPA: gliding motility-associated C-terminal domain-containing protein [Saprospiraceae bacterium]|nr:gliding motility-associated C-terminal domain-containing protein [Saprospiraceae bacterium]
MLQYINLAPTANGGWYAAGLIRNGAGLGAYVSKFEADGSPLWSKIPADNRECRAMVTLNDGSLMLFNNNSSFQGYFDASMLHLGADGSFISETIWGKPDDQDDWYDAEKMSDGSVIAIGMTRESSSFSERILLAKFSATGQILWEKAFDGGGLLARFSELLPLPSGEFYAIGQNFSNGATLGLLAKFAANGNLLWVKSYQYNPENTYFAQIQDMSDGSLFIAAYQTEQSVGNPILTLLNVNANGDINFQKSLDSSYDLAPIHIAKLNGDTFMLAAVSSGQIFPVVDNDFVALQFSPQGDLLGSLGWGTDGQDFGFDAFLVDQQVVICGFSDTSLDGTARRALISKSNINASCCEKPVNIINVPAPSLPAIAVLPYTVSSVPVKQSRTISLSDFFISGKASCQGLEGVVLLPADTSLCVGDTLRIALEANVPGNVQWNTGANGDEILVNTPGLYTVTLSGECGSATDSIEVVSIGNRVDAVVPSGIDACPGEPVQLTASGGMSFRWLDADGELLSTLPNPSFLPLKSTQYQVIVYDGECLDSATVLVNVLTGPIVSAEVEEPLIRLGEQTELFASGASSFVWSPATGLSCTDCANPQASPSGTTIYTVLGLDANGCSDTAWVEVVVQQPCPYYIPNVFYPETSESLGNGLFGVFGKEIALENYRLRIFSRWGELVFESKDPQASWDGTIKNEIAQAGVYVYYLEMTTCEGPIQKSGDITLIR